MLNRCRNLVPHHARAFEHEQKRKRIAQTAVIIQRSASALEDPDEWGILGSQGSPV